MSTNNKNERIPETKNEVRIPLPDGRALVFTPPLRLRVRFRFSTTISVENYEPETPRPAPAGCPTCAKVTSLMPDLSGRRN